MGGDDMSVKYEVLYDGADEARVYRFDALAEAMQEAERVCRNRQVTVLVVRVQVLGKFVPEAKWIEQPKPDREQP